ncbi:hypothetical protein TSAR_015225 [Trichomalopsis sarcophagae]|uniref:Uncharacterized protein n=1 Tax=Trichomalopsis sarcophagae TaxID=543379 RepID=A0A232FHP9_9HYME|nr:hypothetical protein TSAR_015225 [Trichomalopsis sarcophagae]
MKTSRRQLIQLSRQDIMERDGPPLVDRINFVLRTTILGAFAQILRAGEAIFEDPVSPRVKLDCAMYTGMCRKGISSRVVQSRVWRDISFPLLWILDEFRAGADAAVAFCAARRCFDDCLSFSYTEANFEDDYLSRIPRYERLMLPSEHRGDEFITFIAGNERFPSPIRVGALQSREKKYLHWTEEGRSGYYLERDGLPLDAGHVFEYRIDDLEKLAAIQWAWIVLLEVVDEVPYFPADDAISLKIQPLVRNNTLEYSPIGDILTGKMWGGAIYHKSKMKSAGAGKRHVYI